MKLRANERCPLHRSFFCECKKQNPRLLNRSGPIRRIDDPSEPKGYREICSPAQLRLRKHKLMESGQVLCIYCGRDLRELEYPQIELCHIKPKGMNGGRRNDAMENLALGCKVCNRQNGSRRP